MKTRELNDKLAELPFRTLTTSAAGELLYEMSLKTDVEHILELGFAYGTSTAYMAAALQEKGHGAITTIDRDDALAREPNIHRLLSHVGLEQWVSPIFAGRSYTWELMRFLERRTEGSATLPLFDFCFIDGAHTWDADGLAFLIVHRLLRPDRWIVFDDINWTLGSSPTLRDSPRVRALPADEMSTPQVRKIVDLLVRPLGYAVRIVGSYAIAYKPDPTGTEAHRRDLEEILETRPELVRAVAFPRTLGKSQKPKQAQEGTYLCPLPSSGR